MTRVSVTIENHIAQVRLTRADKMNAVDQDMIDAIIAAGQEVAASNARVVVLSGDGKGFCAGIDVSGLTQMIGKDPSELLMPRTHGDGTTNQWQGSGDDLAPAGGARDRRPARRGLWRGDAAGAGC